MGSVYLPLDQDESPKTSRWNLASKVLIGLGLGATAISLLLPGTPDALTTYQLERYDTAIKRCEAFKIRPGPTKKFFERKVSDRFDSGTKSVLVLNATVWTGNDGGKEILYASDICLDGGLIKSIGSSLKSACKGANGELPKIIDAQGAWVTPGIIDMHSHIGVQPSPSLEGSDDGNAKLPNPTHPWFRSIDGLNTHDQAYRLVVAGGTTSSLVLVGSAHSINGESYAIKHRPTPERTPDSLILERGLFGRDRLANITSDGKGQRYMKFAMGENPSSVLSESRSESNHFVRQAFHTASSIKVSQDGFCDSLLNENSKTRNKAKAYAKLKTQGVDVLGRFPGDESKDWDVGSLVDLLRGDVKVMTHCYEAADLATFLALGHEFGFETTSFHHAHEAYTVPELLKTAWGSTPAVSIFVLFANYKREAWRASKFAAAVLEEAGIDVIMKSDHAAIDSGSLNFQAGMAHHYGLSLEGAMNAITTIPARRMGLAHRIGSLKVGYDADLVIWDAHPLSMGTRPKQVIIDGIPQLRSPLVTPKSPAQQRPPPSGNFTWFIEQAKDLGGESSDLTGISDVIGNGAVTFTNVTTLYRRNTDGPGLTAQELHGGSLVVVKKGEMQCIGGCDSKGTIVDLKGGTITPGIIAVGSSLGLGEIAGEVSTVEGPVAAIDLLSGKLPLTTTPAQSLLFGTKDMKQARQAGVSKALTWAEGNVYSGLSTHFATNAQNILSPGAVIDDKVALHFAIGHLDGMATSVAQQLAALRTLLAKGLKVKQENTTTAEDQLLADAAFGKRPLAIQVASAEYMAALIKMKADLEALGAKPNIIFLGALDGHKLASEIAVASIPVILPQMTYPSIWEYRNVLAGKPLERSLLEVLSSAGVHVAIGSGFAEKSAPANFLPSQLIFDVARYRQQAPDVIDSAKALAMVTTDIEEIFGLTKSEADFIAWEGDPLEFGSKVKAISQAGSGVEVFR